jgi:hypothetical protein
MGRVQAKYRASRAPVPVLMSAACHIDLRAAAAYVAALRAGKDAGFEEPVAQSVEHVTFNHGVVGSSPTGLTN